MDLSGTRLPEDAAVGLEAGWFLTLESDEQGSQPINYRWQANPAGALAGRKIRGSEF